MLCEKYLFNILFCLCCSPFACCSCSFGEVSLVRRLLDFLLALWLVCFSEEKPKFCLFLSCGFDEIHTFNKISAHHTYTIHEWCGLPCRYDGRKKERKATAPRSCSMPYFNTSTNISYLWNKYDCANPSKNMCPIVFLSRSPNNLSNFYQLYTVSCILCYAILYLY